MGGGAVAAEDQGIGNMGMEDVPRLPGTYALILWVKEARWTQIGRLGEFRIPPGWLVYVGSARGPGGLSARLARHLRHPKPSVWHVDFLRPVARPTAIWWATGTDRWECLWAAALAQMPGASRPIPGFGSSDCHCPAHLFHFPEPPERELFARLAGAEGIAEVNIRRNCSGRPANSR